MSPRPRSKGNIDLPPHVKVDKKKSADGVVQYFKYVMPDGKTQSLGTDRAKAVATAVALNEHFNRHADLYQRIVTQQVKKTNAVPTIAYAITKFAERQNQKKYADRSRENLRQMNDIWATIWGDKRTNELTVSDISEFLDNKNYHSAIKHRTYLIEFCQFMTSKGWASENIAEKTIKPIKSDKQRQRIEYDELMAIREISPDWLQRALDLALHSTQRRGDLVLMHRDMVDISENTLTIMQEKTQNYDKPVYIKIDMHEELHNAVMACLNHPNIFKCRYLLSTKPERITRQAIDAKPHQYAILPGYLSKQFAKYRDKTGLFDDLPAEQKPSFHEIRSLGIHLAKEKYGKEYAQALAGHASEEMTNHYLEGHEVEPELVTWRKIN